MDKLQNPRVCNVSLVADNILRLWVQEGSVGGGVQVPYEPLPGETLEQDPKISSLVYIVKDGQRIGVKVEDRQLGARRFPYEYRIGEELNKGLADAVDSYCVNGKRPVRIFRKTKPNNIVDPYNVFTYEHSIYLVCGESFTRGMTVTVTFKPGIFDVDSLSFDFCPETTRSEAIHVNQLGYRKDDPSKRAYLSQWMGLGGGVSYDKIKSFSVINEKGEIVFSGTPKLNHTGEVIPVGAEEISSLCPIYELDFSAFAQEGEFRILVPELGCSYPFPIHEKNTWAKGFRASMNALYCQRSGIVTGKPYSQFQRPRVYHPDDGRIVYQSTCSLLASGNGLNCYGTDTNNFGNLIRGATEQIVENAWGGYFDACDWDRRIQHLTASKLGIELYLMFPAYFASLPLSIPESGNGIPDILNEAMYNIDFYKRLQLENGGIRGGIEAEEHPILGQCGWQDAWKAYAYAPDFWSSYFYASTAARLAYALTQEHPEKAEGYRASAEAAFAYAERTYAEDKAREGHKWTREAHSETLRERESAAADLFRLTGASEYDQIFRERHTPDNYDAAFVYCSLPEGMGDETVKADCRNRILDAANRAAEAGNQLPYRLTTENIETEYAGGWSHFCTVPRNQQLIRAHYITGETRYLSAAIAAAGFGTGANPENLCFTTGIGSRYPQNILHHDSRMTGQAAPVGITVCGPHDFNHPDDAIPKLLRADFMWPGAYSWPSFEAYLDIYRHPCMTEYTVMESLGPNAYQWGYFAARDEIGTGEGK